MEPSSMPPPLALAFRLVAKVKTKPQAVSNTTPFAEGNAHRPVQLPMAMEWTETGTQVLACAVALLLVSATAVTLRLISRGRILHILGPTDWFMALTLVRDSGVGSLPRYQRNCTRANHRAVPVLRLCHHHLRRGPYVKPSNAPLLSHAADRCCNQLPPMGSATTSPTFLPMRSSRSSRWASSQRALVAAPDCH